MESVNSQPDFLRNGSRRGVALIIVLGSLVFLSALVLAFLSGVKTDLKSSKLYAAGTSSKLLADSAVNLVMAQIKSATAGQSSGTALAWASQPGMIRTYDTQGNLVTAYKLYSAAVLTTNSVNIAAETSALANWSTKPAHFTDLNAPTSGKYPILTPSAEGVVEGFSFSTLPSGVSKGQMPVSWLYILKNGEIVAPTAVTNATTTATIVGASSNNPIVGRIAFWTDDECSKININTASAGTFSATSASSWKGTFWDTPRGITKYEKSLGQFQPVKNEFQRYPGHPATTDLSTVLGSLSVPSVYDLTPRYVSSGGSQLATVAVQSISAVVQKGNRLYSSVDELMFDPSRNTQGLSVSELDRDRFFLTANSRAPEVNLFNQPRIAMWPINSNSGDDYRSVQDRLIAFCSTINGNPYYFQRSDPDSPSNDYSNISRNATLLSYLQRITAQNTPGFGGNFSSKYGSDRNQILAEIFDYIRCQNLNDQSVTHAFAPSGQVAPIYISGWDSMGFGRFPVPYEIAMDFVCVGIGARPNTGTAATPVSNYQYPPFTGGIGGTTTPHDYTYAIQGFLSMSFLNPAMGNPTYVPAFTVKIEGMDQFTINATPAGFPSSASTYVHYDGFPGSSAPMAAYETSGGLLDPRWFVINKKLSASGTSAFPFFSKIIEAPFTSTQSNKVPWNKFAFTGGTLTVSLFIGNNTDEAHRVMTIKNLKIPDGPYYSPSVPDPMLRLVGVGNQGTLGDRFVTPATSASYTFFGADFTVSTGGARDTVQSMVTTHGDARMTFRRDLDNNAIPIFSFNDSVDDNYRTVNASFVTNEGWTLFQKCYQGHLVEGLNAWTNGFSIPVPHTLTAAYVNGDSSMPLGDWDTGNSFVADGPFINKADEGDLTVKDSTHTPYFAGEQEYTAVTSSFFSPNRMIPSSGMLGSLPTGVKANKPWRTLLFRPDPTGKHPGSGTYNGTADSPAPYITPPDHLVMDLFWMPVIEPYPISEPFSTAGKVNMNYQIMPFTFINRETAVRAVLKWERPMALPATPGTANQNSVQYYKDPNKISSPPYSDWRYDVNLTETLKGFSQRFATNDIFRSASEIALIHLVPKDNSNINASGITYAGMRTFWDTHALNGDNVRERPYANLYSRLTTKSNTFTVHFRVQTLQKIKTDPNQNKWVEGTDLITGEYRGSTILERFIDPNDTTLPDYAANSNALPLDNYYRFRVVSSKQFNP